MAFPPSLEQQPSVIRFHISERELGAQTRYDLAWKQIDIDGLRSAAAELHELHRQSLEIGLGVEPYVDRN